MTAGTSFIGLALGGPSKSGWGPTSSGNSGIFRSGVSVDAPLAADEDAADSVASPSVDGARSPMESGEGVPLDPRPDGSKQDDAFVG